MQRIVFLLLLLICFSCSVYKAPKTEFRGVWVATVVNIDWPKNGNDNSEKKKKDFIEILDFYQDLNFNAAIVQIRTAGDAFYESDLSPWSKYLTGEEGVAPENFDKPLEWMIEETHKRGMEFHAWLNPYRATFDLDTTALSKEHDYYLHPEWMLKYGKKYYYNPGLHEVQQKLTHVIEEIVTNYEVDAIHFDDYFYPYKIKGEIFNDSLAFQTYGLQNQTLDDWRRSNVDSLVKNVHKTIKQNKPWVQFGISPFGVWKNKSTDPNGSETRAGQTNYEDLYADPLLWIEKEWLDYLVPQVYWSMDYPPASHRIITQWWSKKVKNTNLYIGNGTYKIKNNPDKAWKKKNEIPKQLSLARSTEEITGNIFFSAKSLIGKHENITKGLKKKFYKYPAQNPVGQIKTKRTLPAIVVESAQIHDRKLQICVSHEDSIPRFLQLYSIDRSDSNQKQLIGKRYLSVGQKQICSQIDLTKKQVKNKIGISLIDAYGNESQTQIISQSIKQSK
ncbi:glycoside hydrolase family 10 protein [Flagellimonas sp. S3867]|uniref:glycoside hydrolase family 10 protein n=1 Tax=Flagellimonas sp. S3867 TaxID=2768063 RepID=UPI0016866084|nr:family 10 glycosylhydrolase [Flagellimonas sp. S3867]